MLASGSRDNTVKLWETRSCYLLRTLEGHTAHVDIVAISPDGRLLASKSGDQTYENKDTRTGYVVAAEVDVIANRLLGTEPQKQSVLPLLLDGEKTTSLPPPLHGRVHADFRDEFAYFTTAFDLILSLYRLAPNHPVVADLRESLSGRAMM